MPCQPDNVQGKGSIFWAPDPGFLAKSIASRFWISGRVYEHEDVGSSMIVMTGLLP